jgi:hypothetical protein
MLFDMGILEWFFDRKDQSVRFWRFSESVGYWLGNLREKKFIENIEIDSVKLSKNLDFI